MDIPPGSPVKAAQSIGPCPSYCGLSRHTTVSTLSGACPSVPAAWLPAAALCDSYGKYSLSETDVQRSANDANGAWAGIATDGSERPMWVEERTRSRGRGSAAIGAFSQSFFTL